MPGKGLLFVNGHRWEYRQAVLVQRSISTYLIEKFALVDTIDGYVRITVQGDEDEISEYQDPSGVYTMEVWGKVGMWQDGDVSHWRTFHALSGQEPQD